MRDVYWHIYEVGAREILEAVLLALNKSDFSQLQGMHKDYPSARYQIEAICVWMGAEDIAKALHKENPCES